MSFPIAFRAKLAKGRRFPVMVIPGGVTEEVCNTCM
ncbi:hypothetical protein GGQ88_002284 [Novosphingobium hassiacum]|uniref:Uncharacterized protein n=1 Tax=Novosphingobium hassiacum TaxID=173676 RepID=A0A7W5ZX97_9SPHN|nr:hypothetical protein [Novosphingobium hassiacum]